VCMIYSRPWLINLLFVLILSGPLSGVAAPSRSPAISIITDEAPGGVAAYGLGKLTALLSSRNIAFERLTQPRQAKGKYLLIAGLSEGNGAAAQWLRTAGHGPAHTAEALILWHTSRQRQPVLVASGYDDTGLLYALQEITRQISQGPDIRIALNN